MKRLALALALSLAVAATVTASAATLGGVNSSLGADDAAVGSCDANGVSATYTLVFTPTLGFTVDRVVVGGIDPACDGKRVDVVLSRAGNPAGQGSGVVPGGGTAVVSITGTPRAEDVDGIHIAIN